jgi:hypothetical protein
MDCKKSGQEEYENWSSRPASINRIPDKIEEISWGGFRSFHFELILHRFRDGLFCSSFMLDLSCYG